MTSNLKRFEDGWGSQRSATLLQQVVAQWPSMSEGQRLELAHRVALANFKDGKRHWTILEPTLKIQIVLGARRK